MFDRLDYRLKSYADIDRSGAWRETRMHASSSLRVTFSYYHRTRADIRWNNYFRVNLSQPTVRIYKNLYALLCLYLCALLSAKKDVRMRIHMSFTNSPTVSR